jgi:hypothetical protein
MRCFGPYAAMRERIARSRGLPERGLFPHRPALWRDAATTQISRREVYFDESTGKRLIKIGVYLGCVCQLLYTTNKSRSRQHKRIT